MLQNSSCALENSVLERPWQTDIQVVHQLEDMKEQTTYMTEFRSALKYALNEVQTLRNALAEEKSKGFNEISTHVKRSKEIDIQIANTSVARNKFYSDSLDVLDLTSLDTSQNEEIKVLRGEISPGVVFHGVFVAYLKH